MLILAVLSLLLAQPTTTVSQSQAANGTSAAARAMQPKQPGPPCANLGNPPTVGSCWLCFKALLLDCDQLTTVEGRKSCYEGANTVLGWCLGRTTVPPGVSPRPAPVPGPGTRPGSMIIGQGASFAVRLPKETNTRMLEVTVRLPGGVEKVVATTFLPADEDGITEAFFSDAGLPVGNAGCVGVVVALLHMPEEIGPPSVVWANAQVLDVIRPDLDVNGDGMVDKLDYIETMQRYAAGEISFEVFNQFVNSYFNGH